jgi:hypothetical protein
MLQNEVPVITSPLSVAFCENTPAGSVIYNTTWVELDAYNTPSFAFSGKYAGYTCSCAWRVVELPASVCCCGWCAGVSAPGVFTINSTTGTVHPTRAFDFEADGGLTFWVNITLRDVFPNASSFVVPHLLTIQLIGALLLTDVCACARDCDTRPLRLRLVTVTLADCNDRPSIVAVPSVSVAEVTGYAQQFYTAAIVDEDASPTPTFAIGAAFTFGLNVSTLLMVNVTRVTSRYWTRAFYISPTSGQLTCFPRLDADTSIQGVILTLRAVDNVWSPQFIVDQNITVFITDQCVVVHRGAACCTVQISESYMPVVLVQQRATDVSVATIAI